MQFSKNIYNNLKFLVIKFCSISFSSIYYLTNLREICLKPILFKTKKAKKNIPKYNINEIILKILSIKINESLSIINYLREINELKLITMKKTY